MGSHAYRLWRQIARAHSALVLAVVAGCAAAPPAPAPDVEPPTVVQPAEPVPVAIVPAPPPPPVAVVAPTRAEIAVVLDTSAATHAAVAEQIVAELSPRLYRVTQLASTDAEGLAKLSARAVTIVAVGAEAVRSARAALPGKPLVFCQVLGDDALNGGGPVWGVESLPPLLLQLKSWQAVDPSLRTIALIVSESGAPLAAEARHAASELAADLVVATSSSDRETLYLFRRLATEVDGLWLLPDNEALSPQVLRELLEYAAARGIGVLTFNDALLRHGALLSATTVSGDVAETVRGVVERVVAGKTANLPPMTPLSAAELTINPTVATALGLAPVLEPRWVARDPD